MALKKSVCKKNAISEFVQKFLDFIASLPANKRLSLEEIVDSFTDEIDKLILKTQSEGNTFITGTFSIMLIGGMAFKPDVVMYFAKPIKEDNVLTVNCDIPAQTISRLNPIAISELREKKKVEFEITAP